MIDRAYVRKLAENKKRKRLPVLLSQAAYVPPVSSKVGRKCDNCALWVETQRCLVHEKDQPIAADAVCIYHVYGKPAKSWVQLGINQPLYPEYSGLEKAPSEGTRCSNCLYYKGERHAPGDCRRLVTDKGNAPARVHGGGCCALWEGA